MACTPAGIAAPSYGARDLPVARNGLRELAAALGDVGHHRRCCVRELVAIRWGSSVESQPCRCRGRRGRRRFGRAAGPWITKSGTRLRARGRGPRMRQAHAPGLWRKAPRRSPEAHGIRGREQACFVREADAARGGLRWCGWRAASPPVIAVWASPLRSGHGLQRRGREGRQ